MSWSMWGTFRGNDLNCSVAVCSLGEHWKHMSFVALCTQSTSQICLPLTWMKPKVKNKVEGLPFWHRGGDAAHATEAQAQRSIMRDKERSTVGVALRTVQRCMSMTSNVRFPHLRHWYLISRDFWFLRTYSILRTFWSHIPSRRRGEKARANFRRTQGWWKPLDNRSCLTNQPNLMNLLYPAMPSVWPLEECLVLTAGPATEQSRLSVLCSTWGSRCRSNRLSNDWMQPASSPVPVAEQLASSFLVMLLRPKQARRGHDRWPDPGRWEHKRGQLLWTDAVICRAKHTWTVCVIRLGCQGSRRMESALTQLMQIHPKQARLLKKIYLLVLPCGWQHCSLLVSIILFSCPGSGYRLRHTCKQMLSHSLTAAGLSTALLTCLWIAAVMDLSNLSAYSKLLHVVVESCRNRLLVWQRTKKKKKH